MHFASSLPVTDCKINSYQGVAVWDVEDRLLNLAASLLNASVAEWLPEKTKSKSRKAVPHEGEPQPQRTPQGALPQRENRRALAEEVIARVQHREHDEHLAGGGYVPGAAPHGPLSAALGANIGYHTSPRGDRPRHGIAATSHGSVERHIDASGNVCRHIAALVADVHRCEPCLERGFDQFASDGRHDRQGRLRARQHGDLHRQRREIRRHRRIPDRRPRQRPRSQRCRRCLCPVLP